MVAISSITKGIFMISIIMIGSSHAVPSSSENQFIEALVMPSNYTLPPYIASRTQTGSYISNPNPLNRLESTIADVVFQADPLDVLKFTFNAALSAVSYCRSVTSEGTWDCPNCVKFLPDAKIVHTFSSKGGDTTGYIVISDFLKTIYLTFRGTNSLPQIITDLIFTKTEYTPFPAAKVHTGFFATLREVGLEYFFFLETLITLHPDYKIVINGHSLGGAHAILAGMDLYQRDARVNRDNLSIFTIGCPRIGDSAWALYVASTGIPIIRAVHKYDPVPHLPPHFMGFSHVGIEVWEDPNDSIRVCPSIPESNFCANSVVSDLKLLDHLTYFGIEEGLCL